MDRRTDERTDGNAIASTALAMRVLRRAVKIETRHPVEGSLWSPYVTGQAIIFLPCGFVLSIFFPCLISAAAD